MTSIHRRPTGFAPLATLAAAALALSACADIAAPNTAESAAETAAPSLSRSTAPGQLKAGKETIAGQYIVVLNDHGARDVPGHAKRLAKAHGGAVKHVYGKAIKGFALDLPDAAAAALAADPSVAYVEQNQVVRASGVQYGAPWGLDRLDQRTVPLNGQYTWGLNGATMTVYIIDTGLLFGHTDFGGRATSGYDAIDNDMLADDCNGHGTHVAGTVGGTTHGAAKQARLVGVRVLGCDGSGTTAGVIAGVDWVTTHHLAGQYALANMSLGGGASQALDAAVRRSIADGVVYVVAAGNDDVDACSGSPARVAEAITVGATNAADQRASFSNWGACLDLFAPGEGIKSAWYTGTTATATLSGTSMAAPHVTGFAAVYMHYTGAATAAAVSSGLVKVATLGQVTGTVGASPNRLLFGGFTAGPAPAPGAPCTLCTAATGTLATVGAAQVQPNGASFTTTVAGVHKGWLQGPAGTDFDLYLQRWNGTTWVYVAWAETASSDESFSYSGPAGTYRWIVASYAGTGAYTFWQIKP